MQEPHFLTYPLKHVCNRVINLVKIEFLTQAFSKNYKLKWKKNGIKPFESNSVKGMWQFKGVKEAADK